MSCSKHHYVLISFAEPMFVKLTLLVIDKNCCYYCMDMSKYFKFLIETIEHINWIPSELSIFISLECANLSDLLGYE